MSRDAAHEAGGRSLYEDIWLPELWPAWDSLNPKRREEYRSRFAEALDAALPHLQRDLAEAWDEGWQAGVLRAAGHQQGKNRTDNPYSLPVEDKA